MWVNIDFYYLLTYSNGIFIYGWILILVKYYLYWIYIIVIIVMIVPEELYDNSRRIVRIKSNNIIIVLEELIVVYLYDSLEGRLYEINMSHIGVEFLLLNFP